MSMIVNLHNTLLTGLSKKLEPWFLPSLARFTFVAVLFVYFWNSATLKLGDNIFSLGFGAYGQILPLSFEAAGYDPSQLGFFHKLISYTGTYAEFILPVLLLIGLFTRLAALGMIGFIAVQTLVDITGHQADAATIGGWFDRIQDSPIMDQRLFWITVLLVLFVRGGGPLSVDRVIGLK
ncbi:MAG: DoxX family protein [Rhodobacteraceae bacterium]|nr:DoxX family protein [Paracoccaceae bacterium]